MQIKTILSLCLMTGVTSVYAGSVKLPQTGQTGSIPIVVPVSSGADGSLMEGVTWNPDDRFSAGVTSGSAVTCTTSGGGVVVDGLTGLIWTQDGNLPNAAKNWADSLTYANDLDLCGYDDWRLPNKNELISLVNYAVSSQDTWLNNSGGFSNVQADGYWSSSTYAPSTDFAWYVFFGAGNVNGNYKSGSARVWPVRGSSE